MKRWRLISLYAMLGVSLAATRGSFAGQVEPPERPSTTPGVTVVNEKTGGVVSLKVGAVLEVRLDHEVVARHAPTAKPEGLTREIEALL